VITENGAEQTYDPKRLRGVSVYREMEQAFAVGDRIQFSAPNRRLEVANRDLATIEKLSADGSVAARLSDGRSVTFSSSENPHFDHGYAVTSHSSQGLTAERVLVNVDTGVHPDLINSRFAYVSVSRARFDARIYTNDAASLSRNLGREMSKSAAIDLSQQNDPATAAWGHRLSL
jgi:ATP-dependent exoDNAse (exonuclease V) alpha subunit